ncbi:BNR-4 repeat-containing protein [Negadavirga shengliensis]|uniref:BNR-4 repeat-containing protein n=1 Tax=Negadavirga shengliensis TaxID=1389218 RepID=A0ABV9T1Y5_9BACT
MIPKYFVLCFSAGLFSLELAAFQNPDLPIDPYGPVLLSDDGSWCWFQDKRAILHEDKLYFSGVTADGKNTLGEWDLEDYSTGTSVISHDILPPDDHNVGALMIRPDGKILTVYAGHGIDSLIRFRISQTPLDITSWQEERQFKTNGRVTYSNIFRLETTGITYNFYRGNENNPHYLVSQDDGDSWKSGGRLFEFEGRSYLRYASDGKARIHFITTDGHPRHFNNNIYHGYIENDQLYRSDGTLVGPLSQNEKSPYKPSDFTLVYDGDLNTRTDVAWTSDIQLDQEGNPYITFSVTKDPITRSETTHTKLGGFDHRYHYASWNGKNWDEREIAYAGSRLYPGENEYTGLISLHPNRKDVVYMSADVDPKNGKPLMVDGKRRYEIFRGESFDGGSQWEWTPVTYQSDEDNIRPIVLADNKREIVIWLKGRYTSYKDYQLKVYGKVLPEGIFTRAKKEKNILFLISEDPNNYEAPWTIPAFAGRLEKETGHQTQVILGEGERTAYHFPGLEEKINDADLLVLFLRRVALRKEQMAMIKGHLLAGKPVVGIRTANHAFSIMNEPIPETHEDWWEFVPEILGHENQGYGPENEKTEVRKEKNQKLLQNIPDEPWISNGNIYLVSPLHDKNANVLLNGTSAQHQEPIAWTRKAGKSKIFYTSLGYPTDFSHPNFLQLLLNGISWTLQ